MPSSQTTRNRLEKQATGENSNTWGDRFNSNFADLIDVSLDGMTSFTLSAPKTLTANNYASDESRARYLNITGGTGGTVTIPNLEKLYLVRNASSGTVTFTTGSGTTADVAAGAINWIVCEAGNVVRTVDHQAADALLTSIAGLTFIADSFIYGTGSDTAAVGTITSFGRSLVAAANAAAALTTLGAQASDALLASIAGLTFGADSYVYGTGSDTAAAGTITAFGRSLVDDADATTARATLELGSASLLAEATAAEFRDNTADRALSTDQVWTAAEPVALTDAATVAVDMSLGFNFTLLTTAGVGATRALGNPTNAKPGQSGFIRIAQDGTGNRAMTFGTNWKFNSGSDPTLSTAASSVDVLYYTVLGASEIHATLGGRAIA